VQGVIPASFERVVRHRNPSTKTGVQLLSYILIHEHVPQMLVEVSLTLIVGSPSNFELFFVCQRQKNLFSQIHDFLVLRPSMHIERAGVPNVQKRPSFQDFDAVVQIEGIELLPQQRARHVRRQLKINYNIYLSENIYLELLCGAILPR